jgi:4-hydroxybenzoate polyprenyltransferase
VLRGFVDACHPLPTLAVTSFVTALALAAGRDRPGALLTCLAVLCGQLSVGWSNDARDADRDQRAGRTEKPTVRGAVRASWLWPSAFVALAASTVLSFLAAGPVGGTAHVIAVLSAWAYNLALKTTVLSALPYAVSFGLIPAFVTYGLTPAQPPAAWLTATCALLGVGAHLTNALPDVDSDVAVQAGGLVARIGARAATLAALGCVVAAVLVLLTSVGLAAWLTWTCVALTLASAVAVLRLGHGRALFRYVVALAALAVVLLLATATSLTG